jgi:hypothetical protein
MPLNFVEVPVGRRSSTPLLVKHLVRFGRRLRAHHIQHANFPAIVDDSRTSYPVRVGNRVVNVFNDGQTTACLRPVDGVYDRYAMLAARNRWHALWLNSAGKARRMGWFKAARADLTIAIEERRLMNHD